MQSINIPNNIKNKCNSIGMLLTLGDGVGYVSALCIPFVGIPCIHAMLSSVPLTP